MSRSRVWITGPTATDPYYVVWCSAHRDVSATAALPGRLRQSRAIAQRFARQHCADDKRAAAIARDWERETRATRKRAQQRRGRAAR